MKCNQYKLRLTLVLVVPKGEVCPSLPLDSSVMAALLAVVKVLCFLLLETVIVLHKGTVCLDQATVLLPRRPRTHSDEPNILKVISDWHHSVGRTLPDFDLEVVRNPEAVVGGVLCPFLLPSSLHQLHPSHLEVDSLLCLDWDSLLDHSLAAEVLLVHNRRVKCSHL
jgi:hypothetical protein